METGYLYLDLHTDNSDPILSVETRIGKLSDPPMQAKSVTPTEQAQTVSPDTGYEGLSSVGVGAIPGTYVGSQVLRRTSGDVLVSGPTVTIPAGYYASQLQKTVLQTHAAVPVMAYNPETGNMMVVIEQSEGYVNANSDSFDLDLPAVTLSTPTISQSGRTITAQIVQDAGYTPGGTKTKTLTLTAQTVPEVQVTFSTSTGIFTAESVYGEGWHTGSTTKTGSYTLTTQAGKTVTPTTSTQTAVAANRYTTGAVKVGPIPSQYIIPSGSTNITANGTHDVTQYASAVVAVPGPSGTISITANGTYNVSSYASASVAVPVSAYLPLSGGTMTGALTLDTVKGKSSTNYGTTLPGTGSASQIFFLLQS